MFYLVLFSHTFFSLILPRKMKHCLLLFLFFSTSNCLSVWSSGNDGLLGIGNLLRGATGTVVSTLGGLFNGNKRLGTQGNSINQYGGQVISETNSQGQAIPSVTSELDGVFEQIRETAESVENTVEIIISVNSVADVVYATLAVVANVNYQTVRDNNNFCKVSAYLEAAVERLLANVNCVVNEVAKRVKTLDEADVPTLKWVIEAIATIAGNTTNAVSAILEQALDIVTGKTEKKSEGRVDTGLIGLKSALSGISESLRKGTSTTDVTISAADLKSALGSVTNSVASLLSGLKLTNITDLVADLVSSTTKGLGSDLNGVTGTLSGTLKGVAGGVLSNLNGITAGAVSQLLGNVSGIDDLLSKVALSVTQVLPVVTSVIDNASAVSDMMNTILVKLGSSLKVSPCGNVKDKH